MCPPSSKMVHSKSVNYGVCKPGLPKVAPCGSRKPPAHTDVNRLGNVRPTVTSQPQAAATAVQLNCPIKKVKKMLVLSIIVLMKKKGAAFK